jgi:ribonucleoside-triphosphate reductase
MNGFGQMKDGRGNIAPNTIILPTLAMMTKGEIGNKDIEDFMNILDKTIFDARDQLIERYNWICSQDPKSATFMYGNNTMRGYVPEEGIRSALKHGTLAIGQIGLAETLQILIGEDQTTDKGMELAKKIEKLFNTRCDEFKHELHKDPDGYEYYLNFGVYFTPAESLSYTSMKKFQKKYGKIPNISENDFFSNSIHVPVWKEINPFEKIDIESQLTKYSNAGCITYVDLESSVKNNLDALETIVNYAMDKRIPYFAINVPNDTCMNCGFTDDLNDSCPECGSTNIQRLRRVTGYISTDYHNFNLGKQQEVEMRYKHSKKLTNWNR